MSAVDSNLQRARQLARGVAERAQRDPEFRQLADANPRAALIAAGVPADLIHEQPEVSGFQAEEEEEIQALTGLNWGLRIG